ncbi:tetratricopeptide repeat protein [Bacillus sp. BGMRC 2118]|nr:tetratricopeptide repeat protein [Bacillus sp. BGMRC 2118]
MSKIGATKEKAIIIPFHIDSEHFFKKGLRAYRNSEYDRAIYLMKRAHELDPEEPFILCQLAAVLADTGQYQASIEYLRIVIEELDPDMVECYYFMSSNYAHLGLFQEAKKHALKYVQVAPDGEFIEDTEDLLEVLSIESDGDEDEDDVIFLQDYARQLMEAGEFHNAINVFNELLEGHPQFWSAHNNLALAHFYIGEVEKALSILDDVLQQNPGNLHAMCNKLVIYFYLREEEKVELLVNQLKNVHPILTEHRYKLGATFGMVGKYELALPWLLSLKRSGFEGDATFFYWLSYSAYHMNHVKLAEQSWKKVLIAQPDKKGFAPWEQTEVDLEALAVKEILTYYLRMKEQKSHELEHIEEVLFQKGFLVADLLYSRYQNEMDLSNILMVWFQLLPQLPIEKLRNTSALAAAVEYMYLQKHGAAPTKKAVSETYNISTSTTSKYISMLLTYLPN